mmetsp:Transcript_29351/g.73710  ORF Transcript_29351/g.73710 Transcript_29351/m.73710 type:complete len:406 (-) Transcript_29351:85-1302(-)
MQRLIVGALRLHADIDHLLEGQLDAGLHHGHHNKGIVEVLLLWDVHLACRSLLESSLRGLLAPLQKVDVVVVPVLHHGLREVAGDDVVLVLRVQRPHDNLQLLRQLEAFDLRGVVQAVHHPGDAAVLERLGDRLPAILDELGGVARINPVLDHLVEAQDRARLQHAAKDGLLAHEVALDLCDEGAEEDARAISAGGNTISLCEIQSLTLRVVLGVHRDQCRHTEAALVLLADLRAWALRRDHNDCQVVADLHALLDDVEAVAVRQRGALLHERHDLGYHGRVLLVGREVQDDVRGGDEVLIGTDLEPIGGRIHEALALALDRRLAQGVADVEAGIAHVKALVEALSAATDNDKVLALDLLDAICKLTSAHEAAAAELVQLLGLAEGVEVVVALVGRAADGEGAHG